MINILDTIRNYQVLWVVGTLERLATLGFLQETPVTIAQDKIDEYLLLDEMRDGIFSTNAPIKEILKELVHTYNKECNRNDLEALYCLVVDYKDKRTELVKYALSFSVI